MRSPITSLLPVEWPVCCSAVHASRCVQRHAVGTGSGTAAAQNNYLHTAAATFPAGVGLAGSTGAFADSVCPWFCNLNLIVIIVTMNDL